MSILGNELIRNEIIAVAELAKNSYDADAEHCKVILHNVARRVDSRIEIADDGVGMNPETLLTAWLEPARDNKVGPTGDRPRTAKGRLPLGEKGIGRFATDKLGKGLEIITRASGSTAETRLYIESDDFTKEKYLDEVEVKWKSGKAEVILDPPHGTMLKIGRLRTEWTEEMVEQLSLELAGLSSPLSAARDFEVTLQSNEFPQFTGKIVNPLLPLAHYRMIGTVDDEGIVRYVIDNAAEETADLRDGLDRFQALPGDAGPGTGDMRVPRCGPFRFEFYVWDKDVASMKRVGMDQPKRDLLARLSGVRIYRDGFRVWPYGEPADDWLELNKRRVQNPGMRLGTDRIIGYVEIGQKTNPYLRDKTNREGLIVEGLAYGDLQELILTALKILEEYRFESIPHVSRTKRPKTVEAIAEIRSEFKSAPEFLKALSRIERLYAEDVDLYEDRVENLLTVAGIGMTAERLTHEFNISLRAAKNLVGETSERVRSGKADITLVLQDLGKVTDQIALLQDLVDHLEPLYYSKRSGVSEVNVQKAVEDVRYLFDKSLRDAGITMEITTTKKLEVRANKGHMLQIFVNLLDNAIYWLKTQHVKNPLIRVQILGGERKIVFADNGYGVLDKDVEVIFEPFFTRKKEGRGLGLFIAREVLSNYNARINLALKDKILPGANFVIEFPREDIVGR